MPSGSESSGIRPTPPTPALANSGTSTGSFSFTPIGTTPNLAHCPGFIHLLAATVVEYTCTSSQLRFSRPGVLSPFRRMPFQLTPLSGRRPRLRCKVAHLRAATICDNVSPSASRPLSFFGLCNCISSADAQAATPQGCITLKLSGALPEAWLSRVFACHRVCAELFNLLPIPGISSVATGSILSECPRQCAARPQSYLLASWLKALPLRMTLRDLGYRPRTVGRLRRPRIQQNLRHAARLLEQGLPSMWTSSTYPGCFRTGWRRCQHETHRACRLRQLHRRHLDDHRCSILRPGSTMQSRSSRQ